MATQVSSTYIFQNKGEGELEGGQGTLFYVLHDHICHSNRDRGAHRCSKNLLVVSPSEREICGLKTELKKSCDVING